MDIAKIEPNHLAGLLEGLVSGLPEITLVLGCGACPEAYDAFDENGIEVGYLRLRHGYFRAECFGEVVYSAHPKGDGIFEYDERDSYLEAAKIAIGIALLKRGYTAHN